MNRSEMMARVLARTTQWDMVIVGGGATASRRRRRRRRPRL